jgi:hypothetical protein
MCQSPISPYLPPTYAKKRLKSGQASPNSDEITGLVVYRAFIGRALSVRKKHPKIEKKFAIGPFSLLTFQYQTGRVMADRHSRKFGSMLL